MSLEELLGKQAERDITNAAGLVLVPARFPMEQEHIRLLEQHRVNYSEVILMDNNAPGPVPAPVDLVLEASRYAKDSFEHILRKKKVPLLEIKNELLPRVQEIAEYPDMFYIFAAIKAKDEEYMHKHSVGVGVLSIMLGKWLGLGKADMALLSLAAVLHDVGKVKIPGEILQKPGKLTPEESAEMKRHTIYGYEMLKETVGLNTRVAQVALQHHERADGRGYPLRLKGNQPDVLSRIVAVSDVYHAMSSHRPYHEALPFHEVVDRMRKGAFGQLDPHVSAVFLDNMIRGLIGRRVKLTDGRRGEVVFINPHDDTHPLVKVGPSFLDLSEERRLHIQEVIV
ncbi:HD-GYP domain-containing protein [Paenibacillus tyrfis]|uniref:HD-GYP domain-containing protein n=1 Tax=Paenibacillus tyrfis TaxID=1501230 RepID=UPI0020A1A3E6|nr:HD-GYP domain-containing protein [Paenibacillus tyrfis]MCP1307456.1 HD-GYP domain-containing protein [Paenibacillus tyrfis]